MDRFIQRANIERYERLLEITTDETKRQRIIKLLEEERTKNQSKLTRRGP